eukprot:TRINITY_DN694_c4_g1_i1.p2 TRINITY_DN694_c4_g1~~TRINITY_DN694_c4_g1_i1.p2  ORF type:complete len:121 (+),score=26.48 TRINITY_DN694_c4_g1_i1:1257-1619(+)
MNTFARHGINRSSRAITARQSKRFASHGDDLTPEDAIQDIRLWKRITGLGIIGLIGFYAYLRANEEHQYRDPIPYGHLNIRRKIFPWGDGDTHLFYQLFGKPKNGLGGEPDGPPPAHHHH